MRPRSPWSVLLLPAIATAPAALVFAHCSTSDETTQVGPLSPADVGTETADGDADAQEPSETDGNAADSDAATSAPKDPFLSQGVAPADTPAVSDYEVDALAGTVRDKSTGLVWTREPLASTQVADAGGQTGLLSATTQLEARALCASATIGGKTGWRLPTRVEFLRVVPMNGDHLGEDAPLSITDRSFSYWVATSDPARKDVFEDHTPVYSFRVQPWASGGVLCVWSPYSTTTTAQAVPTGRYVIDDTTVTDTVTRLMWRRTAAFSKQITEATAQCTNLDGDAGGLTGWRLPRYKELATLFIESQGGFDATAFPTLAALKTFNLWTSTHYNKQPSNNASYFTPNVSMDFTTNLDKPAAEHGSWFWGWGATADFAGALCVRSVP